MLDELPGVPDKPVALRIRPAAERSLRAGHPWLFRNAIVSESRTAEAGTVGVVFDRKDRFLAVGLYDPHGPIRVRLLGHGRSVQVGPGLFRNRFREALERREGIRSEATTGFRVLHGENDRLPGVVADLYDRTLVFKVYTAAWLPHLRHLVTAGAELLGPDRTLLLVARRLREAGVLPPALRAGAVLSGPPLDAGLPFREHGLRFEAHPLEGHKTGFYLDQRENRRRLEGMVRDMRVLNVFSYTGAFSVYAARGGAREVVSVDRAGPALAQARRHFDLNREVAGISACRHRTVEGDAFSVTADLGRDGERFHGVVVDPPSFTRKAADRDGALASYRALARLAASLLHPGGLLVHASCSSRVPAEAFFAAVAAGARDAGRPLTEEARTGHPPDHPVGFPEGAYLKCLWARVP